VDHAIYSLIQSPKLWCKELTKRWYKELTGFLKEHGFKICPSDKCILQKRTNIGNNIMLILYDNDILALSMAKQDRDWVLQILTDKYKKVTHDAASKLCYLGMVLNKVTSGYEISMKSYN
jgi:hypothetical protein